MQTKKILIFIIPLFLLANSAQAQSWQVRRKIAKAERVVQKQKRDEIKDQKKKVKMHRGLQTKETQSRMKETEKKAAKFNRREDKTIFNRIFNKRQRKAKKKYG